VVEAAAVIRAERADIVTLNEVCRDDVSMLERTLSDVHRGGVVVSAVRTCGGPPLLNTVIQSLRAHGGQDGVILGADLNLRHGHAPDAQSCLPVGFVSAYDGAQQYVVASTDFTVTSARSLSMHSTTDHPGLVADLASP